VDRVYHPKHQELRPSGSIGIRLGFTGLACFAGIYMYAIRKRVKPLGRLGKTRNWLNIHIVLGLAAPVIITLHSSFKMQGLAGIAYWIMLAVMASGIVGRYLYSQIPRSISAAELSLQELQTMSDSLAAHLRAQRLIRPEDLEPALAVAPAARVAQMRVVFAVLLMLRYDVMRPFELARLRRRFMSWPQKIATFGGMRRSGHQELERVMQAVRRQSWLATKIAFLSKTQQVFHLWHVVHRPFSYSFAILVGIHIAVVVAMGYF
jgi:hypothetical protein